VRSGRVHVNGLRVRPSRDVRPGDVLEISAGEVRRTVVVRGTALRRGPASAAALLYEETPESIELRERMAQARRLTRPPGDLGGPRPTKRDRRRLDARRGRR